MFGKLGEKISRRIADQALGRSARTAVFNKSSAVLAGVFRGTGDWAWGGALGVARGTAGSIIGTGGRNFWKPVVFGGQASLLKGAVSGGLHFGAASILEEARDSRWGEELPGSMRFLMGAGAFMLRAGGYRHIIRGAAGTGFIAAGRMQGQSNKYVALGHGKGAPRSSYQWTMEKLGGVFQRGEWGLFGPKGARMSSPFMKGSGSLYGMAAHYAMWPARKVVKGAARIPLLSFFGSPYAVGVGVNLAYRGGRAAVLAGGEPARHLINVSRRMMGRGATTGRMARPWFGTSLMGEQSLAQIVSPRWNAGIGGKIGKAWDAVGRFIGVGKEGLAPVMAGTFGIAGGLAYMNAASKYNARLTGNRGMPLVPMSPQHYQGGIRYSMGPARNFGPALTLQLARNSNRRVI